MLTESDSANVHLFLLRIKVRVVGHIGVGSLGSVYNPTICGIVGGPRGENGQACGTDAACGDDVAELQPHIQTCSQPFSTRTCISLIRQ